MNWIEPQIWKEGDVWILGGGPSIIDQFGIPQEIVAGVKAGTLPLSSYSDYMHFLHNKHVIGINVAYKIGAWIDMVFFGDANFFLKEREPLSQFSGIKISCTSAVINHSWVKYVEKDREHPKGITKVKGKVSWNHNSGAAAISVAAHLGARRIYLLGFDMKLSPTQSQHWHNEYKKESVLKSPAPRTLPNVPFNRHLLGFPQMAKDARSMGIEIINVCPDSAIEVFKKVSLKELL